MPIKSYKDLVVWQKSMSFTFDIYRLTAAFPKDERFGLTAQLRRAEVSIANNIAEGHGRATRGEFLNQLSICASRSALCTHQPFALCALRFALKAPIALCPLPTQIGHGPMFGSRPNVTVDGPNTISSFATVSFTATLNVRRRPCTWPAICAGMVGPIGIGKACSM